MADILVVDDEIGIRELLSEILGDEGHTVHLAESAARARALRDEHPIDLVLLDIWMPQTDGLTLLKEWAAGGRLTMPVVMMSGHATIDTAVEATRIGALDFLEKPISLQKLLKSVEQALARHRAARAAPPSGLPRPGGGSGGTPPDVAWRAPERAKDWLPVGGTAASALATPVAGGLGGAVPAPPLGGLVGAAGGLPLVGGDAQNFGAGALPPVARHDGTQVAMLAGAHAPLRELPLDLPLREARDAFERAYFEHHLLRENGSMTRVAERTGLERTHLYRKLKQLGIDLSKGIWRRGGPQ